MLCAPILAALQGLYRKQNTCSGYTSAAAKTADFPHLAHGRRSTRQLVSSRRVRHGK